MQKLRIVTSFLAVICLAALGLAGQVEACSKGQVYSRKEFKVFEAIADEDWAVAFPCEDDPPLIIVLVDPAGVLIKFSDQRTILRQG